MCSCLKIFTINDFREADGADRTLSDYLHASEPKESLSRLTPKKVAALKEFLSSRQYSVVKTAPSDLRPVKIIAEEKAKTADYLKQLVRGK